MKKKRQEDHSHSQLLNIHARKSFQRSRSNQNQLQSAKVIHVKVRSRPKIDLHSIKPKSRNRHEQSLSNKSWITQTDDMTQPTNVSTVHPSQSNSLYKSQNLWCNDDFESTVNSSRKIFSDIRTYSTKVHPNKNNDVKLPNKCPDWTTFENNHFQKNKKKKKSKCIRVCIIISIIVAILLAVAIIVPLVVLLNKPKSNTITVDKPAILRWNATGITIAGVTGQSGNGSNQLYIPIGLTFDYLNALYIADYANNRIQKYANGSLFGITVAGQANTTGCNSSACLLNPADVAVDSNRNIYVLDTGHNRVQLWSDGSTDGVTVAGNNSSPNLNDRFSSPYGISSGSNSGTIYIADTLNNRVMCYRLGSLSGTLYAGTGVAGINNTQLNPPYGIYFDLPSNSLLIGHATRHTIVRWAKGATHWTLVAGSNNSLPGSSSTALNTPVDVTSDPIGNVYVADTYNHRIQFFPVGESNGITIAGINQTQGTNASLLNTPYALALDSQLNLYVADTNNHRIQKFLRY